MKRMCLGIVLMWALLSVVVWAQSSANYKLVGANLSSGGSVNMASTNYKTSVTFGQSSPVGVSNSASYQAQIGVQYVYRVSTTSNSYILWTN